MNAPFAATLICLCGTACAAPCTAGVQDERHLLLAGLALMAAIALRRHGGPR